MWGCCNDNIRPSRELVMPDASRSDLSHAFCSYSGYPPMGLWRVRAHRVCMRWQMGVFLHAPAGAEPRHDAPFLILDRQLTVQAVSRHAEIVLSVDEPAGVGIPLEELVIFDNGCCDDDEGGDADRTRDGCPRAARATSALNARSER
jgi:hypothetical protein